MATSSVFRERFEFVTIACHSSLAQVRASHLCTWVACLTWPWISFVALLSLSGLTARRPFSRTAQKDSMTRRSKNSTLLVKTKLLNWLINPVALRSYSLVARATATPFLWRRCRSRNSPEIDRIVSQVHLVQFWVRGYLNLFKKRLITPPQHCRHGLR